VIRKLTPDEARAHAAALGAVLADCVAGGASVNFMHPFILALSWRLFGEWSYHLSSFLPMRQPAVATIRVAIGYQVITKSALSSVQFAA
jgi:hypothetical protein